MTGANGSSGGGARHQVTLDEAASVLRLPVESVEALVGAGYLRPSAEDERDGAHFALTDLKAFLARNADGGQSELFDLDPSDLELDSNQVDPQTLVDALDGRAEEMATRAFEIFALAFPEAESWSASRRGRFIEHSRNRFEAILAVTRQGQSVDEELTDDLAQVGASAAWSDTPLPEVLLTLRISRDLVVQTAVEVAESHGSHWGLALSLLLTRVLPAMDRLTDAIATGYWDAVVRREEESSARYAQVVESSSDGVYEVDHTGHLRYANGSLAVILGLQDHQLEDRHLSEVLIPADAGATLEQLISNPGSDGWSELRARRADGVLRVLNVRVHERLQDGVVIGMAGVVRDITAYRELEQQKNDFLALITHELRQPLTTILGLGITLGSYADELGVERVRRMGKSIHQQAERIARLADDLFDVSRLESNSLLLSPRDIDIRPVVEAALGMLGDAKGVDAVEVRVPPGLEVRADARRLEQVIAHLVENALNHGAPPVVIEAADLDTEVEISVRDHGSGVPAGIEQSLFSQLHPTGGDAPRYRDRTSGLGLVLVRGLVEAMGGRAWYEAADEGGSCFLFTLPTPHRRR
jgi:PAS domain S-box-containing protein